MKTENGSTVCSGSGILSAVKVKLQQQACLTTL